ncbi:MAG: septum formation inhibitor Maf [Armatimonadetes bacterium]|nr:septum formation inhibitor Maf [Armatimonadota bacterium]
MAQNIILASASPRRRELLSLIIDDFRVLVSEFDESSLPADLAPEDHVVRAACSKARQISWQNRDSLVIGADTIVVVDDEILGKPVDETDAARMLRLLSGRSHEVYSGICIISEEMERQAAERTEVVFRDLSDEMILRYIATGEPKDKAGAYGIQGKGAVLVKCISGCYSNVVGLPLYKLSVLLKDSGIEPLC